MIKAKPKYATVLYGTIYIDNIQKAVVICLIIPTIFPFSSNQTDCHNITEILLKMVFNIKTQTPPNTSKLPIPQIIGKLLHGEKNVTKREGSYILVHVTHNGSL
jgi:hypothetical protein